MKTIVSLLLKIALTLTTFSGSARIASSLLAEPVAHPFSNIDMSSHWTTQPVRIDPSIQTYERLPPRDVPTVPLQIAQRPAKSPEVDEQVSYLAGLEEPAIDRTLVTGAIEEKPVLDEAHVQWCQNRYRSYRADDNSYQPYSGPRRQCALPVVSAGYGEMDVAGGEPAVFIDDPHVDWCARHYRSYRAEDNSYRSYSGRRRQCHSPHG